VNLDQLTLLLAQLLRPQFESAPGVSFYAVAINDRRVLLVPKSGAVICLTVAEIDLGRS